MDSLISVIALLSPAGWAIGGLGASLAYLSLKLADAQERKNETERRESELMLCSKKEEDKKD